MNDNFTQQQSAETRDRTEPEQIGNTVTIPVIEEQLQIGTRIIETGKVRIIKKVNEFDEFVNIPLASEKIEVERIEINQFVDAAPQVRYEGETMIIPVVKEVSVVRLMLVEEVRVTKHKELSQSAQYIKLRKEEVQVERRTPDMQNNKTD